MHDKVDFDQKFQRALFLDVAGLFSLAILGLAFEVSRLAASDLLDSVRSLFFGGPEGIARREQILKSVEALVIHASQQTQMPLGGSSFQLDPPYLQIIAEVVARVIARPLEAGEAPRYLKLRLMHGVLYGENDLPALIGRTYSAVADKLAGDIALAFMKAAGFDLAATKDIGAID